jgi:hypothetical protein
MMRRGKQSFSSLHSSELALLGLFINPLNFSRMCPQSVTFGVAGWMYIFSRNSPPLTNRISAQATGNLRTTVFLSD